MAKRWGKETLAGGGLDNKQFNDFVPRAIRSRSSSQAPDTTWTPRVLKDGSDSVGALGALNRVYLNIGLFSEEWLLHFKRARRRQADLADRDRRRAEELGLLAGHRAADAEHGAVLPGEHRPAPSEGRAGRRGVPDRGRRHAAARQGRVRRALRALPLEQAAAAARRASISRTATARTISLLEPLLGVDEDRRVQGADARDRARRRLPRRTTTSRPSCACRSTLLQTNACSPLATNAIARQHLGQLLVAVLQGAAVGRHDQGAPSAHAARSTDYTLPGGGRGYTRPASLVSLWSTAPFLQNNTVGPFDPSPSVEARMRVVPGVDRADAVAGAARARIRSSPTSNGPGVGWIQRTTADSYIRVPRGLRPRRPAPLLGIGQRLFPMLFRDGEVEIGPIPKGTPVSLITNMDLLGADLPRRPSGKTQRKKLPDAARAGRSAS